MGLAGNKEKQRISTDPNNLTWSNDQSKFGFRMLQQMGWAPGKGLGVNEDGNQEHVKIKLKDDTLGLGANKKTAENWLGNTDAFSQLLADLNSRTAHSTTDEKDESSDTMNSGKRKSRESSEDVVKKKKKKEKKDKKKVKKIKKEKKDKKKKEKRKKAEPEAKQEAEQPVAIALRNAARAKFLRAKRMATQNDQARLNEILGVRSSTIA